MLVWRIAGGTQEQMLDYDEKLGGYRMDITDEQLKNAPKIEQRESWERANQDRDEEVHGYWE